MRPMMAALALLIAGLSAAEAHGLDVPDGPLWLAWSFDPWAMLLLVESWIWFGLGIWRLSHEVGLRRVTTPLRVAAFAAGLAILAVALLSPIDTIGDSLFWLHMIQHLLLTLAAPPLLVWSRPAIVLLWAFPRRTRKHVAMALNRIGFSRTVQGLMNPVAVWLLFTGAFLLWHLPGPFQFALDHEAVHDLEHLSFFVTALMFWSVVIAPSTRQRLGYGARLLFLTTNGVLTGFPGALMVLAPRPLYQIQALRSAEWGLTGLQDQQIAGAVMWVVGGFAYVVAGAWLFARWLEAADRAERARSYRAASIAPALLLPLVLAECKEQGQAQAATLIRTHGDAQHGAKVIKDIGCGNCHSIPGIAGADGVVGPPLTQVGRRIFLAGVLRNTPANMILWLRTPQAVLPGNAMPDSGLSEKDARDVAAYLASLD
jgi:cytochrome c oxidase assembly factor CtaG